MVDFSLDKPMFMVVTYRFLITEFSPRFVLECSVLVLDGDLEVIDTSEWETLYTGRHEILKTLLTKDPQILKRGKVYFTRYNVQIGII